MPTRMKFLEPSDGKRVECYLLAPRLKIDKERTRILTLFFSVKMNADLARSCDARIARAWEDCEDLERQISSVSLKSEIENTNIDFFELNESKTATFELRNITVEALHVERADGITYLYFAAELKLHSPGLGRFALDRYCTSLFCEFKPSQFAFVGPAGAPSFDEKPGLAGVVDAIQNLTEPLLHEGSGITSMTLQVPGHEPVVLNKASAEKIRDKAKQLKKGTPK